MNLFTTLVNDHDAIDRVLGSFRSYIASLPDSLSDSATLRSYFSFFENFMRTYHHEKEEVIFRALVQIGLPEDRGPLLILREEHEECSSLLEKMKKSVSEGNDSTGFLEVAVAFSHLLWEHIDKENSVLFMEAQERIKGSVLEGAEKELAELEQSFTGKETLLSLVEDLARVHPSAAPDVIRGLGCIQCRFYTNRCGGMEHEWWSDEDWENLHGRMQGD